MKWLIWTLLLAGSSEAAWTMTTSMQQSPTSYNSGVLLVDGRVVFASACPATVYNPDQATWTNTGSMSRCHSESPAVRLADGTVLSAGQTSDTSAFVLDPATLQWHSVPSMQFPYYRPTLSTLNDGTTILIGAITREYEVYDFSGPSWSCCGQTMMPRYEHTATLLNDGRLLVVGGEFDNSAEVYDPATQTWSFTGPLTSRRDVHTSVLLNDGRVLVVGGYFGNAAEIFDPNTNQWSETTRVPVQHGLEGHVLVLLNSGRVLLAGGGRYDASNEALIYDPSLATWTSAGKMNVPRNWPLAVKLLDGTVLVAGGNTREVCPSGLYCYWISTSTAEIFSE